MSNCISANQGKIFNTNSTEVFKKESIEVSSVKYSFFNHVQPSLFKISISNELALLTLLLPAIAAQAVQESTEEGSNASSFIDTAVASIIARELIEGSMFVISHFGPVSKSTNLSADEKNHYKNGLRLGLLFGVCTGGVFSVAVGLGFSKAVENLDSVKSGVEIGEAISKALGTYFVGDLSLKIPKWFGLTHAPSTIVRCDVENQSAVENIKLIESPLESRLAMSLSLFWNTLRETTEGGVLIAISALLSKNSLTKIGASVGVGGAAALIVGGGTALGAKFVSPRAFGYGASALAGLLAVGLLTGAVHSAEEIVSDYNGGLTTPVVFDFEGTHTGDILTTMGFMGLSDKFTILQLTPVLD